MLYLGEVWGTARILQVDTVWQGSLWSLTTNHKLVVLPVLLLLQSSPPQLFLVGDRRDQHGNSFCKVI